ncbi:MAG: VCBS repeat-containing protein [Candidatus Sulfotelmatobacter sp.]
MKYTPPSTCPPAVKPWFLPALKLTVFWLFAASALFSQTVFNGPRDYLVGPSPDSVVVADFNGDGRADIATASQSSATVSVLLRNSDGTFQPGVSYAAGNSPNSMRPLYVADVNNDGKLDLLVLNTTDQTLSVLLGNGDGTFQTQKVTTIAGSYCCLAVGDFNGDGKVDIAAPVLGAVVGTYGFAVLLGKGDGTFQAPVSYPSAELFALTAADLTNNGKLDLVTDSSVMLGNGDGIFQAPIKTPLSTVSGLSILIADFNQDGILDIATSNGNFLTLMLGNGDGTFREQVLTVQATPLALGDLNGDGIPDLIAEGTGVLVGNGLESLLNLGDGTFTVWQYSLALAGGYSLGQFPIAVSAFAAEPNPYLVLATASGGELGSETAGIVSVLNASGDGTFGTFATFPLPYPAYPSTQIQTSLGPLIAADFNGDGKPDLLTDQTLGNGHGESGGQLGLLLNTGAGFSAATLIPLQQCCSLGLGDGDFNGDGHLDLAVGDGDNFRRRHRDFQFVAYSSRTV